MNKKTQQQQFIALFLNRVIRISRPWIISSIIFFCCLSVVSAHTFQPSKVDIAFVSPTQFSITIETDLIELAQTQLALTGTSDELIQKVKTLSKIQLFKLLNKSKMQYQQQIALIFDQKTEHINALFAPNVQSVLQKLSFDAATTDSAP